jgi:integrative and conjugative element protein (TIGR02256 family)
MAAPPATVKLESGALDAASAAASAAFPNEAGGILLGWREPDAVVVVQLIEVVDPRASDTTYTRNHAHAEAALQRALTEADPGDPMGYVGEWHAHPAPQGPSRQDRRELRAIARLSQHPVALVVLAYDVRAASWSPAALTARRSRVRTANTCEELAA